MVGPAVYVVGGGGLGPNERAVAPTALRLPVDAALRPAAPWEPLPPLPTPRWGLCAVAIDDQLYTLGGMAGEDTFLATVERYAVADGRWSALPPMPTARVGAAAAVVGRDIHVTGGNQALPSGGSGAGTAHDVFDSSTQSWHSLPALPRPLADHASVVVGNQLYAVGGSEADLVYDLATGTWRALPPWPGRQRQVATSAAAVVGTSILLFGAYAPLWWDPTVWCFDTIGQRWTALADGALLAAQGGAAAASAVAADGETVVYVMGGATRTVNIPPGDGTDVYRLRLPALAPWSGTYTTWLGYGGGRTWTPYDTLAVTPHGLVLGAQPLTAWTGDGPTIAWDLPTSTGQITFKPADSAGYYWREAIATRCFTGSVQLRDGAGVYDFRGVVQPTP